MTALRILTAVLLLIVAAGALVIVIALVRLWIDERRQRRVVNEMFDEVTAAIKHGNNEEHDRTVCPYCKGNDEERRNGT